jgi:signal transduction histidine kinase
MTTPAMTTTMPGAEMIDLRRARPSARLRILAWILVLTAVAVVGALLLSRRLLQQQLDHEVNDNLEQELEELRKLAAGHDPTTGEPFGTDVRAIFVTFLARNVAAEGEAFYTFVDGRYVAATPAEVDLGQVAEAGGRWARLTEPAEGELSTDAGPVRWLALPVHDTEGETLGVFVVANFLQGERDEIAAVITTGLVVAGVILALAAVVGWAVAGRILRPIREVTETARAITETDLARRIDVEGDDEIAELASTFNAMLDRLQTAFATQRSFVDDAGHELRTPITIVRGHLELLGDDPGERRETVALVTDELDRMSRIVDDLLVLAQAEQPDFLRPEPVDLEPFTVELFAKLRTVADRRWELAAAAEATLVADPQRLTQAVMNLIANAVEHTGEGDTISLGSAAVPGDEVRLWVADTGPGIAEHEQAAIFERFARGGDRRRRSEGAGLGLAIVRAIAEAHHGRVELDSRPGDGARFTLRLPGRPARPPAPAPTPPRSAATPSSFAEVTP